MQMLKTVSLLSEKELFSVSVLKPDPEAIRIHQDECILMALLDSLMRAGGSSESMFNISL